MPGKNEGPRPEWPEMVVGSKSVRGLLPLLEQPGAFGENISTRGLREADLCLGDVLRCGDVLLEVTQTRQPCWKLNDRFGTPDMALQVQRSGFTGWYYRVLEPGTLEAVAMRAAGWFAEHLPRKAR